MRGEGEGGMIGRETGDGEGERRGRGLRGRIYKGKDLRSGMGKIPL